MLEIGASPDEEQSSFEQIVGNSPALKRVLQLIETVAPIDSTVLLLDQTGTGKELIDRAIHDRDRRNDRTFVKVNSGKRYRLCPFDETSAEATTASERTKHGSVYRPV